MRVLYASASEDTAGDGWRTKQGFDRHTDWHYRMTRRHGNYIGYPEDLPWGQARNEWRQADVVHLQNGIEAERMLRAPQRPTVIHHHGSIFRRHPDQLLYEQRIRNGIGLVSTLDLWLMAPDDLVWSPTPYDLDWLASLRVDDPHDTLRIAHAPTNRSVKSTEAFLAAAARLGEELPVEVMLIEHQSWAACLAQKARADVYFDQVGLGYGANAVESWSMGIPVIAGAAQDTLNEIVRRTGGLPFVLADEGSIYEALRLLADPVQRAEWAARGRMFVERFHDDEVVVRNLQAIYRFVLDNGTDAHTLTATA